LAAKAGNYIFAKRTLTGWTPTYIGQTRNLAERFEDHHKKECIKQHGATHVHAHLNEKQADRLAEEADLIKSWHPACND
jgi:predicted GIY-YIG superfamily endonuclease